MYPRSKRAPMDLEFPSRFIGASIYAFALFDNGICKSSAHICCAITANDVVSDPSNSQWPQTIRQLRNGNDLLRDQQAHKAHSTE